MNRTIRRVATALLTLATASALAGCGGSSSPGGTHHDNTPGTSASSPSSSTAPTSTTGPAAEAHNEADVAFATQMIPHHEQAVTMAQLAADKATNAEVKSLAAAISSAQGPEITTMSGWLSSWGQPVPSSSGGHDMSAMGGNGMEGMMTEQEMEQLSAATGVAFDRMWLQMMIRHHQGAVTMARTELAEGQHVGAKELAQQIIDAQNSEIAAMTKLVPTITG